MGTIKKYKKKKQKKYEKKGIKRRFSSFEYWF